MIAERVDQGTDRKNDKRVLIRLDENGLDKQRPDELKEPLKFASTRLRKKLRVRRAIEASRVAPSGPSKDNLAS
jgi:hypothetical protein